MRDLLRNFNIPGNRGNNKERGAALLTVLVALMIITILLFEFQYRTMIQRKLASNELDQLRAYYLAKSGVRIGLLRLSIYGRALANNTVQKAKDKSLPVQQYLDQIWKIPLPPFPPPQESVADLNREDKTAAETILKQTRVEDGQFTQSIISESSKINLNHLIIPKNLRDQRIDITAPPKGLHAHVGRLLYNLIDGFIQNSDDPYEEFGNLRPEEVVYDIMDWVNPGNERLAGGFKDGWYEKQDPPYRAKRNRFYTVDELRLVRGIDDKLFRKLKPYITVYSYEGKININTARKDVFQALYPEFTERDLDDLLKHRDENNGFTSVGQFVSYVTDTLGRSGFKDYYDNASEYPFTTGNRSFVIESLGKVKKSASEIQKALRVGVALVSESRGGQLVPGIVDPGQCKGPNVFVDKRDNKCKYIPTNQTECQLLAAEWRKEGNRFCCFILKPPQKVCPGGSSGGSGGSGAGAASKKEQPPNAIKIMSWTEA